MRCMQNENLFFVFFFLFCLFFPLPSLVTARWQSSSSAVLFMHSSYLMGILLPSFKEAMCLRNDTRNKRKLLLSKLTQQWEWGGGGGGFGGAAIYMCVCRRRSNEGRSVCVCVHTKNIHMISVSLCSCRTSVIPIISCLPVGFP